MKILKFLFIAMLPLLCGCSVKNKLTKKEVRTLDQHIKESPVFSEIFTGFALYDPESNGFLYQQEADKYYTPASNTKIFSFYTALKLLGDSLPVIQYTQLGDTLLFRGMGNPLFLHPDFEVPNPGMEKLLSWQGKLAYTDHHYRDERFGAGWAWDDYPYYYQTEKSPLPLYANNVRIEYDSLKKEVITDPGYFQVGLLPGPHLETDKSVLLRKESENIFYHNQRVLTDKELKRYIPFRTSPGLTIRLLEDTLKKQIFSFPKVGGNLKWTTVQMPAPDTLYKRLLKISDNFIAEQIILMCSAKHLGYLNTADGIRLAKDSLFKEFPDALQWRDGSGLSRYNLFTPRTIIKLLEKLYDDYPMSWLTEVFPAGGVSGTIESWYAGEKEPFVFAKTGTLSNKHCLSGYLRTANGKTLIFSFMNNNYITGSTPVKKEMEKVLRWIRDSY